jgi:hypothetical protein
MNGVQKAMDDPKTTRPDILVRLKVYEEFGPLFSLRSLEPAA